MRRWLAGQSKVPDGVIADVERAARQRVADIYAFMAELTATAAKGGET